MKADTSNRGWHRVRLEGRSAATGGRRAWNVTYRSDRRWCCGREHVVADADRVPVWLDSDYADPHDRPLQCGGCGWRMAARAVWTKEAVR